MTGETDNIKIQDNAVARPPIVVVMGHVDHGKTTLLDWYRKTKVAASEAGGITQHIGAYEVAHEGKRITFIDTPGHEAFTKLRARGARVADIAIVVVAAEEGVKPQTKEALDILQGSQVPFVVAINKIDKPEANTECVKQELAALNVLVESYGGKIPCVAVSAKTGQGMNELLEVLLLLAELQGISADPSRSAEGVVLEAHRDSRRGITATLLILDGVLRKGDILALGKSVEAARILENFRGLAADELGASSPAVIAGFVELPNAGDTFCVFPSRALAQEHIRAMPTGEQGLAGGSISKPAEGKIAGEDDKPIFNIILKTDVRGSQEALEEALEKLGSGRVGIKILRSGIGDIGEDDIKLAIATRVVTIVGFRVRVDPSAKLLAQQSRIHIVQGEVIYEILDEVRKKAGDIIPPIVAEIPLGKAKVLKIFKKEGSRQIVGGRVEEGAIKKGVFTRVIRMKEPIGKGIIMDLQRNKTPVGRVEKPSEFGVMIEMKQPIQEADLLEIFEEEVTRISL